jgi:Domain of unknown function (DUF1906)
MIIDTNTNCNDKRIIDFMVKRGIETVGRYYSKGGGSKVVTKGEAQALSSAGINLFVVYEDGGDASNFELTDQHGFSDATTATAQAKKIGQPQGGIIYFAVEGLPDGYGAQDLPGVRQYFGGINRGLGTQYRSGVYGDGIVCKTLLDAGICSHTWLAQASYSFEGTQAFYASKKWSLAQILTDLPTSQWHGLSVDINEGLGDIGSFKVSVRQRRMASARSPRNA